MAAVSLSPAPVHLSAMSTTRRAPLSNNPNVANSPMRASAAPIQGAKKIRSHAEMLREETYGQPPPAKRQMIARDVASPTRTKPPRTIVHRSASRVPVSTASATSRSHTAALAAYAAANEARASAVYRASASESTSIEEWQANIRARFPKMVFYFESVPEEQRSRLARQVAHLGARDEKFFDREITHVVTTRHIPPPVSTHDGNDATDIHGSHEHPKTIDPSLLNRSLDTTKKKLFDNNPSSRRVQMAPAQEERIRRPVTRSADILQRAQEMKMKIWSVDKLYRILDVLEQNPYKAYKSAGTSHPKKPTDQSNLLQLLQNERVNGPSDRDPTVATKELHYFKGFYLYVYDIEEKTKPIMVREYAKVADKKDGDWPQFRVASQGRCPFVEDEPQEKENRRAKERVVKATATAQKLQPTEIPPPKPVTGKRSLAIMEDGQNRGAAPARDVETFDRSRVSNPPQLDFRAQNAFMSHAKAGRLLAGEPVASGLQPSNMTSAIRSQMISSTGGVLGAKAGTSKEIHGLQRKVLQKASTPAVSQDLSSRQVGEMSHDSNTFVRSASASRAVSRKLDVVDEEETVRQKEKLRRTVSMPATQTKQKREPKPGYCENCQDKFEDFDEHIVSRKHRRFAENNNNWAELDALLAKLERRPRYSHEADDAQY